MCEVLLFASESSEHKQSQKIASVRFSDGNQCVCKVLPFTSKSSEHEQSQKIARVRFSDVKRCERFSVFTLLFKVLPSKSPIQKSKKGDSKVL